MSFVKKKKFDELFKFQLSSEWIWKMTTFFQEFGKKMISAYEAQWKYSLFKLENEIKFELV